MSQITAIVFSLWLFVHISSQRQSFSNGLKDWVDSGLYYPSRATNYVVHKFKAYTVVEPTAKETDEADKALSLALGVFSGIFPNNDETMDTLCDERQERRELYRVFVRRKWTFSPICRLAFRLTANNVEKQNDLYCNSLRPEFMKHTAVMRAHQDKLTPIRQVFKTSLILAQNTTLGFTKAYDVCCAFWKFKSDTMAVIAEDGARFFFFNMFDKYFQSMTQYLCFYHKPDKCQSYVAPTEVIDNPYSIAFNWLLATSKVYSLLL